MIVVAAGVGATLGKMDLIKTVIMLPSEIEEACVVTSFVSFRFWIYFQQQR
jgi:hypothetical protein